MNLSSIKDFMKTKKMIRPVAVMVLLLSAVAIAGFYSCRVHQTETKHLFAMDTSVTITADKDNLNTYSEEIQRLDKMLSAYNPDSEISRLNKNKECELSQETAQLLEQAVKLCRKYPDVDITVGALVKLWNINGENPVIPTEQDIFSAKETVGVENININGKPATLENNARLDLGCCGKGYALDVLRRLFDENAESYAVVSFGSSSLVYGEKPDGKAFVTRVVNPENPNKPMLEFETEQAFISTSGGYERYFEVDGKRYSHIIDIGTGYPVETDLTSVTVISRVSGIVSDFMSTCVYIGGTDKLNDYLDNKDFEIIAVDKNKNVYCSESVESRVEILDNKFKMK